MNELNYTLTKLDFPPTQFCKVCKVRCHGSLCRQCSAFSRAFHESVKFLREVR